MNMKNMTAMLAFVFLAAAMASFAAADNITYVYTRNGDDLATDTLPIPDQENVTLPNTTWNLDLYNNDSRFRIGISGINATSSGYPELNITAELVDTASQSYSGDIGVSSGRYRVKYAYAFDIAQLIDRTYTVAFDYSTISGITKPVILKCEYDFSTGAADMSTCAALSTSDSGDVASASTRNFSSFFLAEDTYTPPGGGRGGTGGGGGGGGAGGPKIIYVTPTAKGESVQVYDGDELVVQYKGTDYHFRVVKAKPMEVELKNLQSYLPFELSFGETKTMGLTSFFARDVEVSMHVSNEFVMLTFKTYERPGLSIPLLPPRPREQPAQPGGGGVQQPPATFTPRPAPETAPEPSQTRPEEVQVPESPINLWTIIFAVVFVIFLVGGVVLYRTRLHRLEKPPTVTRTGLEPTGLPETSSKQASKPAPTKTAVPESAPGQVKDVADEVAKQRPHITLSHAKELELEKYIFHAYSLGFRESQVRRALLEKGWPKDVVDQVIKDARSKSGK